MLDPYSFIIGKHALLKIDEEFVPQILLIDGLPSFFMHETIWVPTLKLLHQNNFLRKVTVDMGAVKFMASGADVMRPGILSIDDGIDKNDYVLVVDEKHEKGLCVGKALFTGSEIKKATSGKVIKNIHYVGDKIWGYTI